MRHAKSQRKILKNHNVLPLRYDELFKKKSDSRMRHTILMALDFSNGNNTKHRTPQFVMKLEIQLICQALSWSLIRIY